MLPMFAQAAGSVAQGVASYYGQREANDMNQKLAREQMAFQERMSSTAYQRSMDDMSKAGLNPILAYGQGGASSPGGAMATMKDAVTPALSSAIDAKRAHAEVENLHAVNDNLKKQNIKLGADTLLSEAQAHAAVESANLNSANAAAVNSKLPGLGQMAEMDRSDMGKFLNALNFMMDRLNPLMSLKGVLK